MTFSLIWLPSVLKIAGLKVATVPGWETRGTRDVGPTLGIICHHTAGSRNGNMPTLDVLIKGRPGEPGVDALPGPLAQLGLGRDGTWYVIAAGRCNHAGAGAWLGNVNGNSNFIGIEAENTGGANDFPWPQVQVDAYQHGVAAILSHLGRSASDCCGHKEYALPAGRKTDPHFDMDVFRAAVRAIMNGDVAPLTPIPAVEPSGAQRTTLRRGMNNMGVADMQRLLGVNADGDFDAKTEAALREFQRHQNMVPDGIAGPKTWAALDAAK